VQEWHGICSDKVFNVGTLSMSKTITLALATLTSALLGIQAPANAGVFSSYECDALATSCTDASASGGNFDLLSTSGGNQAAGGLEYQVTGTLSLSQLTTLSATYAMTDGTFSAGAPRFTLFDSSLNSAWVYWGSPTGGGSFSNPNAEDDFASTGNYADLSSPDVRVYSDGFNGDLDPNTGVTWAAFVAANGSADLSYVTLDLDGGAFAPAPTQEMLVSSFTVNNETDLATAAPTGVPEPVTVLIFGAGLAGAAAMRRHKVKSA
jgi:hypothetical protein